MCNCIETVNAKLAERNTRLKEPMFIFGKDSSGLKQEPARRLFIETEQIETGRGKMRATAMFNSYCPFCGEKLPEPA